MIKKILKEETSLQTKLKNLIDTKGIDFASNAVGGMKNVAKILNLNLDDIDTQEMLVKNFLYHVEIDEIDISFLEVRNSSNGKIIKAYFKTTSGASNITTWFDREISDYLTKELFPFRVSPSWEPSFANRNVKIFLDSEVISDERNNEEELTEKWTEKYKRSINCNNPKGFSQKAHCDGRRKRNEIEEYSRTLKNARRQGSGLRFSKLAVKSNPMRFRPYNLKESELIRVIKEIRDNIALRRRFKEGLDELEVRKVIRVVMNDLYLEDYSNEDSFADEVIFKVTDYFFDENHIMPEDRGYNEMYDDFLTYIQDEYGGMIYRYYRENQDDEDEY